MTNNDIIHPVNVFANANRKVIHRKDKLPMKSFKYILLLTSLFIMNSPIYAIWLSVDPLSDKYPHISPYAYCGWNPVKYVDPSKIVVSSANSYIIPFFFASSSSLKLSAGVQEFRSSTSPTSTF